MLMYTPHICHQETATAKGAVLRWRGRIVVPPANFKIADLYPYGAFISLGFLVTLWTSLVLLERQEMSELGYNIFHFSWTGSRRCVLYHRYSWSSCIIGNWRWEKDVPDWYTRGRRRLWDFFQFEGHSGTDCTAGVWYSVKSLGVGAAMEIACVVLPVCRHN